MNKKLLTYGVVLVFAAGTLIASSGGRIEDSRTSSPLDGQNCTACHASTAQTASGWISTNIPAEGYVAGETYTITATGTHAGVGKFGFQLTAETALVKAGTFIITDAARMQLINTGDAVTHTSAGHVVTNDGNSWSMDWTAPTAGTGEVKFYAAFNAANGNGSNDPGDQIYLENITVQENNVGISTLAASSFTVSPNPATDFISISSDLKIEQVQILTIAGKLVKTISTSDFSNIKVSDLTKGNYLLVISSGKEKVSKKIVIY